MDTIVHVIDAVTSHQDDNWPAYSVQWSNYGISITDENLKNVPVVNCVAHASFDFYTRLLKNMLSRVVVFVAEHIIFILD